MDELTKIHTERDTRKGKCVTLKVTITVLEEDLEFYKNEMRLLHLDTDDYFSRTYRLLRWSHLKQIEKQKEINDNNNTK